MLSGDFPAGTPEAELLKWMRENQPPNTGILSVHATVNPPSKH